MNQKLTDEQVKEIREKAAAKVATQKELAYEYGVARQHISRLIRKRRRWIE